MNKNRVQVDASGPSKVQQHFHDETKINNIVEKFASGMMPNIPQREPMYLDISGDMSHHEMLNKVTQVNQAFMNINPHIRKRFHNNPQELIDFCKDEKNVEEAEKLGLVPPGTFKKPEKPSTPEADKDSKNAKPGAQSAATGDKKESK